MRILIFLLVFVSITTKASELNIDLEAGPFGVPWGASESEVVDKLGKPNGYFEINKRQKLYFYGKSVTLLLSRNKLTEVMYSMHGNSALRNRPVSINSNFDIGNITINKKDVIGNSFEYISKALEINLGKPDYHIEVATDSTDIFLSFSSSNSGGEYTYNLSSFRIKYYL